MLDMFPYIEVSGTHRDIGRAIGETLSLPIKKSLSAHFGRLHQIKKILSPKVVQALTKTVERYFPRFVDEVRGISEGSNVSFDKLLQFSFEEELMPGEKCTSLAVKSGKTILFGHNEDWDIKLPLYVVKARPKGQPRYVSVANAGQFPGTVAGLNEYGFAYAGNSIATKINFHGLPKTYCLRSFLECKTITDAITVIAQAPRAIGNNSVLVSQKEQQIVALEWSPYAYSITEADRGLGHTNHYISKLHSQQSVKTSYSSAQRLRFIEKRMLQLKKPTLGLMKRILRTHINSRVSICRHTGWKTLASIIVDTTARKMYVSDGTPCNHSYKTFSL
jgi:isopenicillin-N N-acyltransferase-like protein